VSSFEGKYTLTNHPSASGIAYNGYGWSTDGNASGIVSLIVDSPKFLKVTIKERSNTPVYCRAKINNIELPIIQRRKERDQVTDLEYGLPVKVSMTKGDCVLFLCFAKNGSAHALVSEQKMYSVEWR
jgi:hypothetical protein